VLPARQLLLAVGLPFLELPQQRGAGHQGAIALHPRSVQRLPAALLHRLLDLGKQRWAVLLQPGVKRRGGMAEMQLGVPLHQAQDRAERALGGLPGVSHRP